MRACRRLSCDDHATGIKLIEINRRPVHDVTRVAEDLVHVPAFFEVVAQVEGLVRRALMDKIVRRRSRRISHNVSVVVSNRYYALRTIHCRHAAVRQPLVAQPLHLRVHVGAVVGPPAQRRRKRMRFM